MNIGDRLRLLRITKGYSQNQVADILGIARTTYVKYESGGSKPTRQLAALAKLYEVSVDYILGKDLPEEAFLLSNGEKECLDKFKQLTEENQYKILGMLDLLIANQSEKAAL